MQCTFVSTVKQNVCCTGVVSWYARTEEASAADRHETEGDGRLRRRTDRVDADQEHQPELQLFKSRAVRRPGTYATLYAIMRAVITNR